MKFSNTFLLFFVVLQSFAQIPTKKDSLSITFLEKKEVQLWIDLDKVSFEDTKKNTYHLISLIKKKKSTINKKDSTLIKRVDHIHLKTLYFLNESIHAYQKQFDSIIYYNSYVKKLSPTNYYMLGPFESLTGWAHINLLDYVAAIEHYRNSLDYNRKSKDSRSEGSEIITLIFMADFYISIKSFSNAEEVLAICKTKAKNLSKKGQKKAMLLYAMAKSNLFTHKNEPKKGLALLTALEEKDFQDIYYLGEYYKALIHSYLDNEMPDMALVYYKKFFETKKFNVYNTPEQEFKKNSLLADIYLQKGEIEKSELHINKLHNTPTEGLLKVDLEDLFARFYTKKGDYKKAYTYLKNVKDKRDSVATANTKIISDIIAYNLTRDTKLVKQKEINELKDKATKKDKKLYLFIFILIILASLFLIGWVHTKKKKKRLKLELELEKIKEIISAKNNFLENISHEIRTPITIIIGYISLIKEHTLEPQKTVLYSNNALLNTERMMASFNDFLTLFRLEKNATYLQKVSTKKIDSYIKELVVSFKANCELKNIALFYKSNISQNSSIEYDYEILKKIIYNLVSNAIKYSSMNTSIFVSSLLQNNTLQIVVKDQGIGIDKKEQKCIFKRFFQSKNHSVTDGFGIGLSLVCELVKKMNGTITLESEINMGSLFNVTLPLDLKPYSLHIKDLKTDFEKLTDDNLDHNIIANNLPKALIVDDNLDLISYLKELFSLTLDCTFATNGQEGLAFASKNKYDIIISDIRMPIMNGIEFKSEINKLENYNETPFIMITATPFEELSDLKITLGFDDYIVKPFTKNEIIIRVQSLLEKNIYRKKILTIDDAEINFDASYSDLTKKMNTVILENLNNPDFDVKMFACECGYSQKQLYKIVQSKTGLTLVNIILEVRLLKAYELILKNSYPTLNEVMFAVGINSRTYFSKKFKERFGIKPNELKKQQL